MRREEDTFEDQKHIEKSVKTFFFILCVLFCRFWQKKKKKMIFLKFFSKMKSDIYPQKRRRLRQRDFLDSLQNTKTSTYRNSVRVLVNNRKDWLEEQKYPHIYTIASIRPQMVSKFKHPKVIPSDDEKREREKTKELSLLCHMNCPQDHNT